MLLLDVPEFRDATHWHWRLTTAGGAFRAYHGVSLDQGAVEFGGFLDLHSFLLDRADRSKRMASEAELVERVGRWIGEHVLGSIGPPIASPPRRRC